jgi:hypothetical protein
MLAVYYNKYLYTRARSHSIIIYNYNTHYVFSVRFTLADQTATANRLEDSSSRGKRFKNPQGCMIMTRNTEKEKKKREKERSSASLPDERVCLRRHAVFLDIRPSHIFTVASADNNNRFSNTNRQRRSIIIIIGRAISCVRNSFAGSQGCE